MAQTENEFMEPIRLNQYLAKCGVCSRRDADQRIREGRVFIDGRPARPGDKVTADNQVRVDGVSIGLQEKVVLAYYKPVGVTCTERDPNADLTVVQALPFGTRLTYAGRLDRDSEGLLIMTNDGKLIDAMMRGSNYHEKEYIVKLRHPYRKDFLKRMEEGVYLDELNCYTRPCKVTGLGSRSIRLVLTQGLNRQIRRMCRALGNAAVSIKRVRVMNIELGSLQPGEYRRLSEEELQTLYHDCDLPYERASRTEGKSDGR